MSDWVYVCLSEYGFFKNYNFGGELVKNSNSTEKLKMIEKNPENSSQKLKGAANPFVLFADSLLNF